MKKYRGLIVFILMMAMVFTLFGCGKKAEEKVEEKVEETVEEATQEKEETAPETAENAEAAATAVDLGEIEIDLGTSELYTEEDRTAAINVIMDEFKNWEGCVMHKISFTDDQTCKDNVTYVNEFGDGETFDEAIVFLSSFHSPVEKIEGTAWEFDHEYEGYNWILGRKTGGDWKLVQYGY
ncbi:MAG: hypothetical protein Q4F25_00345 [Eubacteriales bacterium]|nr:hypothetical protein [Eubacteriales bacterium]